MTLELTTEDVALIRNNDRSARRQLFASCYGKMAAIALRYSKNQVQADEALNVSFHACFQKLQHQPQISDPGAFLEKEFIAGCVSFIRGIRSEYYVASTVYASSPPAKNYDLFANHDLVDFKNIDNNILIMALQQLVPSQRLILNLHVIDGYSIEDAAHLLESSSETAKSNLEKARFNLQKNVEKCLNTAKYEQSV